MIRARIQFKNNRIEAKFIRVYLKRHWNQGLKKKLKYWMIQKIWIKVVIEVLGNQFVKWKQEDQVWQVIKYQLQDNHLISTELKIKVWSSVLFICQVQDNLSICNLRKCVLFFNRPQEIQLMFPSQYFKVYHSNHQSNLCLHWHLSNKSLYPINLTAENLNH